MDPFSGAANDSSDDSDLGESTKEALGDWLSLVEEARKGISEFGVIKDDTTAVAPKPLDTAEAVVPAEEPTAKPEVAAAPTAAVAKPVVVPKVGPFKAGLQRAYVCDNCKWCLEYVPTLTGCCQTCTCPLVNHLGGEDDYSDGDDAEEWTDSPSEEEEGAGEGEEYGHQ
eukprot:TRINITY_DN8186_c0_g1_i1.p2 TRINITY_DN8186_c0_g1~~TRINITY_DN8186_c0_g1_i1.p2  ORF type:complete len:169 (+),score=67.95 TRINITY_DN8186_c0_g1_i1:27-533(+)